MNVLCEKLELFADGELPDEERSEMQQHLVGCERCRVRLPETWTMDAAAARAMAMRPPLWSEWGQLGFVAAVILVIFALTAVGMFAGLRP